MGLVLRSIAMALAASLLLANAPGEEEEQTICLSVAHVWRGDSADIGRIRSVAVPESFRRAFEARGCERYQLVPQSLVDWHLAFGDERTAALGLAYLEAGYRKGAPAPEGFGPHLAAAWEAARRTIAADALPPRGDPRRAALERRVRESRSVQSAADAVRTYSNYVELAHGYARAAEVYGSASLLEKAEQYFVPVRAGLATLFAGGTDHESDLDGFVETPTYRLGEALDLEMRLPVLRARLSRSAADLDAAAAAMARRYHPVLATAADNARERSGDPCEIGGEAEGDEMRALQMACDEEFNVPRRATDFWRNRAHLDLLMAADPTHFEAAVQNRRATGSEFARRSVPAPGAEPVTWPASFETAAWLLRYQRVGDRDEEVPRLDENRIELFALLLARAEMHARRAGGEKEEEEIGRALDYAAQAVRVTPPHDAPALFRRGAETWLGLWARAEASTRTRPRQSDDRDRFAAYLRANLAALDSIATGDVGGAPSAR